MGADGDGLVVAVLVFYCDVEVGGVVVASGEVVEVVRVEVGVDAGDGVVVDRLPRSVTTVTVTMSVAAERDSG